MQTLILNHYPPVIRQIKDIQQIAKSEDVEFSKLNLSTDKVLKNMFVFTADESGVRRFEKMFGIKPKAEQNLQERRMYILSIMNRKKMSLSELTAMLSDYSTDIRLINDMFNMEMTVDTGGNTGGIEIINCLLEEILPMNIYYHFVSGIKENTPVRITAVQRMCTGLKVKPCLQTQCKGKKAVENIGIYQRNTQKMIVRKGQGNG